ncbi:hypothetical protein L917_07807 [Phytophthora nicotianae]|uniref:Uncharacterized protein n=1 Tax=Phytophthora nicotianae TaxID=4792 RepID=W2L9X9_PHYNI|nr:hypothetical protein L917_07807 [Phytophthora nicotianae]
MVFVAPKLSAEQAFHVLASVWVLSKRNRRRFARIMTVLQQQNCFRLRDAAPPVDSSRRFDVMLDDATAKARYRFTITELRELAKKLKLPEDGVTTPSGDRVDRVEALAMLCRRLSEPSKLLTVASEFGRGTGPYSRVVKKKPLSFSLTSIVT